VVIGKRRGGVKLKMAGQEDDGIRYLREPLGESERARENAEGVDEV
jgi:hypothetical protein